MKKIALYIGIILIIFSLIGCSQKKQPTNVKVEVGASTKFKEEEINNAIDCLKENFDFKGGTLTKIYYDEEKSNSEVKYYLQYGKGLENKIDDKNIIVLLSDFDVATSGYDPSLNPGETYTNFSWVLVREDENSNWKINDYGY